MQLNRETVYDLENTYDELDNADDTQIDKMFTQLQPLLGQVTSKHGYKADDIDDKLVQLFTEAAEAKQIPAKWAKAYLFYKYFDEE